MPTDPDIQERIDFNKRLEQFKKVQQIIKKTTPNEKGNIDWEEAGQVLKEKEVRESSIISARDLLTIQFPPINWLVENLIPAEGFTAITGAPASYKSFISEHLAICIASNKPFLGTIPISQGAVLIIDKENPLSLIQQRFTKMDIENNPPIYFLQNPDYFDIFNDEHLNWIINFVKENNIKLLILDSFVHIHKGDENDSMAVAKTFERLKQIKTAILFIHHHRKTIKFFTGTVLETIRGSSDIGAEVESHLALDIVSTGIKVTQSKNRRAELQKPFIIIPLITEESITFQYGGEVTEEISKTIKARDLIIGRFTEQIRWLKQELIATFEGEISQRTIENVIKILVKEGILIEDYEGQKRVYTLSTSAKVSLLELSQGLSQSANVGLSALEQSYLEEVE